MSDQHQTASPAAPSPPKGLSHSPSIFAYQTRILQRTSSVRNGMTPNLLSSPERINNISPPSTPIRQNVSRMLANYDDQKSAPSRPSGDLSNGGRHGRSSASVDLVRSRWESKIEAANTEPMSPPIVRSQRSQMFSPPLQSSSTFSSAAESPPVRTPSVLAKTPDSATPSWMTPLTSQMSGSDGGRRYGSPAKRSTVTGVDGFDASKASETLAMGQTTPSDRAARQRPASISSHISDLTPHSTGNSSVTNGRSQAVEDTLAQARANALKRLEARRKAKGEPTTPIPVLDQDLATPTPVYTPKAVTPPPPVEQSPAKSSPLSHLFEPPSNIPSSSRILASEGRNDTTPTSSRHTYRSLDTPPSAPVPTSRYVPSGLGATTPVSNSTQKSSSSGSVGLGLPSGGDKYGSISTTDRRRLGRHLPRIASGEGGWEAEEPAPRTSSSRRIPSTLGRGDSVVLPSSMGETTSSPSSKSAQPLGPSASDNVPPSPTTHTTPGSKRRSYLLHTPKEGLTTPRAEVAGEEMKGLMQSVGALPSRGSAKDEGEGVTGMSNRLRLSRSALPPSASSRALAPAPLPSRRLMQTNWMDRQRHALAAYEYLCHVGEAQQWIEGCLDEETGFGVTEMEEGLRDGVVLAKLARVFQGESVVKRIWTDSKHRYKQTDNIDIFLKFVRTVGMPTTFTFDPIDLYEKKNFPKVIFCIHVLSHLLARQGLAERIGNLVGQFEFTDEQLAKTQKGLQGVAMPNFGDARKTLAKEASWEPEPEEPEETEDERRDRELLENEGSIISLQRHLRGGLARMRISRINARLDLAKPSIIRFQARGRGALSRNRLIAEREQQDLLLDWATGLQTAARRQIAGERRANRVDDTRAVEHSVVKLQTQVRGVLVRMRKAATLNTLEKSSKQVVGIQAACRKCLQQRARNEVKRSIGQPSIATSTMSLQAVLRGHLHRQKESQHMQKISGETATFVALQSHIRGALIRRKQRAREEKLDDASDYIVAIQAVVRGLLARQKKRTYVQHLQHSIPVVSSLQAVARARLAQKQHHNMQKALAKVEVAGSVGGLQAFLRSKLAKKQTTEQKKKLEFVQPDVIGFQAVARGYLARQEYQEWREYLLDPHTQGALVFLQSLVRGFLARRRLWIRTSYIHRNVDKIVKVQAIWRGRTERQMYQRLLTGVRVDVPTIQNYMHLLDDTESDYQRQIRTEALRREVVRLIRENQGLETEVKDLDTKIALILKNKMTFEELARAKHRLRESNADNPSWKDNNARDPFTTHAHLDRKSQRKLELFEYLFFMLQTKGEYLSRVIFALSRTEDNEKDKRLLEGVILILFGYGQETREDYLFHKLLQVSVHEQILRSKTLEGLANARFAIVPVATQYTKPKMTPYLQGVLLEHILRIVDAPMLDLSTDPAEIYKRLINDEESRTGIPSDKPRDLDSNQVLQVDETARALYIQHLQELRHLTKELLDALYRSAQDLPYTIRLLARECLLALRVKFPDAIDEELTPIVSKAVILPFILSAIIAPEQFGISSEQGPIGALQRKNLASIANLVTLVAAQDFSSAQDHFILTPLRQYIESEGLAFRDWVLDVASVEPLETYFQAGDLLENTVEATPIMITRSEIYGTLTVLMKNSTVVAPAGKSKDPMAAILEELEGPPIDYDRGKTTVCLRPTNRLGALAVTGPEALQKEDWVQAKRHVLAVLRVQTGKTLFEVLVDTPTQDHEQIWLDLVYRDMAREEMNRVRGGLPPTPVEQEYQIESIRSLPFHEVKSRAIEFCMKLERAGRLAREDAFEGLLVSIAGDIRQKHHLRRMQRQSAVAMERAHEDMVRKHKAFEEQIKSYHQFIDSSMASLQKGKKKPTFLSKQYFHQRAEARSGKKAQFGSYKYTAADLYARGILLGIKQLSPNVFNEVYIVIASNEVGVFSLEMSSSATQSPLPNSSSTGTHTMMGREEMRMEDLLQAQFENELNLLAFDGMVTFSINMLIHQINKKFYST